MPIRISLEFDAAPIMLRLQEIRVSIPAAAETAIDRIVDRALEVWRNLAEERKSTGRYQQNIGVKDRAPSRAIVGVDQVRVPYFPFIEFDTEAHIIQAVRAKALRFFWPNGPFGPGVYFAKRVRHPGTKGAHHAERTGDIVRPEIRDIVRGVLDEFIEERVAEIRRGG